MRLQTHQAENQRRYDLDSERNPPLSVILQELTPVADPVGDEAGGE